MHGGTWLDRTNTFLYTAYSNAMYHFHVTSFPRLGESFRKGTCCSFGSILLAGQSLCTDGIRSMTAIMGLWWVICGLGHQQ